METPHCVRGDTPARSFRAKREISSVYVFLGESWGGDVQPPRLKEETPRKGGSEWHIMGRGHPSQPTVFWSSWAKRRISQYWEGAKDPFPTNPKMQKINFRWSWRRGLFPPPFIVMSSEARHLLFNRKGQKSPFRTYPIKTRSSNYNPVIPNKVRNLRCLCFLGGVLRGILSPPQSVGGGSAHLLHLLICRRCRKF